MDRKTHLRMAKIVLIAMALVLLLAPAVSAALVGDSFASLFIKIDRFFANEQYKPYAKAIDFFFFTFLFVAIYLQVIKYAFKEKTRAVNFIAILLGVMSGFLLVQGGYSTAKLLPFIPWFLFALLAAFIYFILGKMGMKNGLLRFLLALLLAALIIFLIAHLLFPDSKKFSDFFGRLGTIDLPSISAPGSGFGPPSIGPGSGYGPGSGSIFPTAASTGGGSIFGLDWSTMGIGTIALLVLLPLLILAIRRRNQIRNWRLNHNIRNFENLAAEYQTRCPIYVQKLNDMLAAYHLHGNRAIPAVVAAQTVANRERRRLARLERRINDSVRAILRHGRFPHLDAHARANFTANVRTIFGRFGDVTRCMIDATRQFRGPAGRVRGIPLP